MKLKDTAPLLEGTSANYKKRPYLTGRYDNDYANGDLSIIFSKLKAYLLPSKLQFTKIISGRR